MDRIGLVRASRFPRLNWMRLGGVVNAIFGEWKSNEVSGGKRGDGRSNGRGVAVK